MPFIAGVQTSDHGHPRYAGFIKQPFATEAVAIWAAESLATSAQVVSDGAVVLSGRHHDRRGAQSFGNAAAKLP